jgi:hypothetical protein
MGPLGLAGAAVLAGLLLGPERALAQAQSPSPGAASSPLTGMWEARWKTQVKSYQVAEDVVGLEQGHRQLEHDGTLRARFNFCADRAGTIHGAGTLRVTTNGSARLFKPFEDRGWSSNEVTCNKTFKPTSLDNMPMTVIGQVRGSDVWLFLNSGMIDYTHTNSCVERDLILGKQSSYVGGATLRFPAVGLLWPGPGGGSALGNGISLPARDHELRRVRSSNIQGGAWQPNFQTLARERTKVQIRRDPLAEMPILFEELFELDLAQMHPRSVGQLEALLLPFFKCDVTAVVTVVIKGGGDRLFLETLLKARLDVLKAWFAGHGIDASRVAWRQRIGGGDRAEFVFK